MSTQLQAENPQVQLTLPEIEIGAEVGLKRQLRCLQGSRNGSRTTSEYAQRYGSPGVGGLWGNHIEGALGEFAVAKFLGLYPSGIEGYNTTDVGDHYEVRTRPEKFHELFIKKRDKPDKYYILLQGSHGEYIIRGWISAYEVFGHDEWFHNNSGRTSFSYWVPFSFLYPISELPKEAPCQNKMETSSQSLLRSTKVIQYNSS